jgi:S1-C subfamily serine protease
VGASDPATGVTILTVTTRGGSVAPTRSIDPSAGQAVAVIGAASVAPDGRTQQRVVTAAVSAVGLRTTVEPLVLHDAVQLDRAVPADATGGLVVDGKGRLVGIVVTGSGSEDLAVVVPAADAISAARGLRDDGEVRRAWLGVRAIDLTPSAAALLDVKGGAQLTAGEAGSPAAGAGRRRERPRGRAAGVGARRAGGGRLAARGRGRPDRGRARRLKPSLRGRRNVRRSAAGDDADGPARLR